MKKIGIIIGSIFIVVLISGIIFNLFTKEKDPYVQINQLEKELLYIEYTPYNEKNYLFNEELIYMPLEVNIANQIDNNLRLMHNGQEYLMQKNDNTKLKVEKDRVNYSENENFEILIQKTYVLKDQNYYFDVYYNNNENKYLLYMANDNVIITSLSKGVNIYDTGIIMIDILNSEI